MEREVDSGRAAPRFVAKRVAKSPELRRYQQSLEEVDRQLRANVPLCETNRAAIGRVIDAVQIASRGNATIHHGWGVWARLGLAAALLLAAAGVSMMVVNHMRSAGETQIAKHDKPASDGALHVARLRDLIDKNSAKLASAHDPLLREARLIAGDGRRMGEYLVSRLSLIRSDTPARSTTSPSDARQ